MLYRNQQFRRVTTLNNPTRETNLKIKQGLPETCDLLSPEAVKQLRGEAISSSLGVIKSELPNKSLYTYEGTLRLIDKELPLNPDQLLLRGAVLRNTKWVYAIVVFTG